MQCRDVEEVVGQEGLAPLPQAVRGHVAGCRHCQGYISDLETIVSAAQELPAEVEPPSRVWVALRTQMELEGIIKEPAAAPQEAPASWWDGFGQLFRRRALSTVTVGALIAVAAVVQVCYAGESQTAPGDEWQPSITGSSLAFAGIAHLHNRGDGNQRAHSHGDEWQPSIEQV